MFRSLSSAIKLISTGLLALTLSFTGLGAPTVTSANSNSTARCISNVNCSYHGIYDGHAVDLAHVINVSVENLPDAVLVGQLTDFYTNNPYYDCLNNSVINVWVAPNEFPNDYIVHNGDQGSQCVYGTWLFPQPSPRFQGLLRGRRVTLDHVANISVEDLPDARPVGMLFRFKTNDPYYSSLNGQRLRVWVAPSEFPDDFVIHNGDQGPQDTYGTWLLPRN